jgi:iron(III) transport system substrate-binding protein
MADVRMGDGYLPMTGIFSALGESALKTMIVDQEPVFSRERRQIIEGVVRGRYPIGMALFDTILPEFVEQGLGRNVKPLILPEADYIPAEGIMLFNKAPHPNAAKLFVNWFLTKDGQTGMAQGLKHNSRRKDVAIVDQAAAPGTQQYLESSREENFPKIDQVRTIIEKLAGVAS